MQDKQSLTKPRKKPDKKKIVDLALNKNLTCREISAITGTGKTRIAEIMQEVKANPDVLLFTDNKDKVFEGLQTKLINLADDELLKTMLSKRGFTDVAILQDKISLLRGQATEIHDVQIRALIAGITPKVEGNVIDTQDNNTVS